MSSQCGWMAASILPLWGLPVRLRSMVALTLYETSPTPLATFSSAGGSTICAVCASIVAPRKLLRCIIPPGFADWGFIPDFSVFLQEESGCRDFGTRISAGQRRNASKLSVLPHNVPDPFPRHTGSGHRSCDAFSERSRACESGDSVYDSRAFANPNL